MTVNIRIEMDDLPRHLRAFAKEVPFATSRALNSTVFDVKRAMPRIIGEDLTLRNKFTAGGSIRVDKSTKHNLEAAVGSVAWYLDLQIAGGTRKPLEGIVHEGKRYIIVPGPDRRNKRGWLKKAPKTVSGDRRVVKSSGGQLLYVADRKSRGKRSLFVFGVLEPYAKYESRLDWQGGVEQEINKVFPKHFADAMDRAARTSR